MVGSLIIESCREGACEPLRVLDHLVKSFITLIDQSIVLFDLLVLGVDVELEALLLTLELHDLFIELTDLHALIHCLLVDVISPVPQLVYLSLKLVEIVVIGHVFVSCSRLLQLLIRSKLLFQNL